MVKISSLFTDISEEIGRKFFQNIDNYYHLHTVLNTEYGVLWLIKLCYWLKWNRYWTSCVRIDIDYSFFHVYILKVNCILMKAKHCSTNTKYSNVYVKIVNLIERHMNWHSTLLLPYVHQSYMHTFPSALPYRHFVFNDSGSHTITCVKVLSIF